MNLEKLLLYRGLEKPEIDGGARAELGQVELRQAFIEALEPRELRVDGEPRVFVDAAIVFVKPERRGVERMRGEVTANVFLRNRIELGVRF